MDNSGLAVEAAQAVARSEGIHAVTRTIGAVKITDVKISEAAEKQIGKPRGRYITLESEPHAAGLSALLSRALSQVIPPRGRLFAVGLGNPDITQDSLGAAVIRGISARKGRRYTLSAIETDVAAKTGLETARLVKAAARELRADCVIAVDALACKDPRAIGRTVQITDAGLIPGAGADCTRGALSREKLGIPVAAVGVPTMTVLSSVTQNRSDSGFHVTTADIDVLIKMWAEVLGGAVDSLIG